MTRLSKRVRRTVPWAPRALVVELHPATGAAGATIMVREARRRTGYSIEIAALHTLLGMRAAEAARWQRLRRRRLRRGLLGRER